jgi:hypothetical protein
LWITTKDVDNHNRMRVTTTGVLASSGILDTIPGLFRPYSGVVTCLIVRTYKNVLMVTPLKSGTGVVKESIGRDSANDTTHRGGLFQNTGPDNPTNQGSAIIPTSETTRTRMHAGKIDTTGWVGRIDTIDTTYLEGGGLVGRDRLNPYNLHIRPPYSAP